MANVLKQATSWLGWGGEEAAAYQAPAPTPLAPRAQNVTRMMAPRAVRRGANDITEIQTFQPRSYAESKDIAATFRHGIPVIINFQDLPNADRTNMLHFILGLKEGLEGTLKRVTSEVFLLGPNSVWVTDEEEEAEVAQNHSDDLVIRP